jgi:HlyD family secretion protein
MESETQVHGIPLSESRKKRHLKRALIISGMVIGALAVGGYYWTGHAKEIKYTTVRVKRGDINSAVQATGTINPLTTVPVGSFVSGTVLYIFADFNTRVNEGQVLAQLDPAIYQAQVMTARGNLANAQANVKTLEATVEVDQAAVAKAEADLSYAKANGQRIEDLFHAGVVSTDQNDLTQSTLGQKEADVHAAYAVVDQARAQLQQARAQLQAMAGTMQQAETSLSYTTILSPIGGTVVARNITVGQSVAASLQAPNVFTIAQDLKRMQVYAKTDESDTGSIRVGTDVTFQVDAFPGELFHGRVSAVRLNAYSVQNVVTYDTIINFDNPEEKLLPGETAYVTIPTGHAVNTTRIPNSALSYTPDLSRQQLQSIYAQHQISREAAEAHLGGWQVVWKIGADNSPFPVAVRVGITDYSNTQLLEGDTKEGDQLITAQQGGATHTTQSAPGLTPQQQPRGPR